MYRILSQLTPDQQEATRDRAKPPVPPSMQPRPRALWCGHPFTAIAFDDAAVEVCLLCLVEAGDADALSLLRCARCRAGALNVVGADKADKAALCPACGYNQQLSERNLP